MNQIDFMNIQQASVNNVCHNDKHSSLQQTQQTQQTQQNQASVTRKVSKNKNGNDIVKLNQREVVKTGNHVAPEQNPGKDLDKMDYAAAAKQTFKKLALFDSNDNKLVVERFFTRYPNIQSQVQSSSKSSETKVPITKSRVSQPRDLFHVIQGLQQFKNPNLRTEKVKRRRQGNFRSGSRGSRLFHVDNCCL